MIVYRVSLYWEMPDETPDFSVTTYSSFKKAYEAFSQQKEDIKISFEEERDSECDIETTDRNYYFSMYCESYNHFESVKIEQEILDSGQYSEVPDNYKMEEEETKRTVFWPGAEVATNEGK